MFQTSPSIIEIAKALNGFQTEITAIKKDAVNPFYKSNYASLEKIWEVVRPILTKQGLSLSQFPTGENELTSLLAHISGEWMMGTVKMTPKEQSPQAQGSAITYMRRYAMSAILGLATEDDDDGNAAEIPVTRKVHPFLAKRDAEMKQPQLSDDEPPF